MQEHTRFTKYVGFKFGNTGLDLEDDKWSQTVVLEALRRYLFLDLSKATLSGWVDDGSKRLHVVVYVGEDVYQDYSLESGVHGTVCVHYQKKEQVKEDPFIFLANQWVKKLLFPDGYPRSLEVKIDQSGLVEIQFCPCF
jgi:hypothetical protein